MPTPHLTDAAAVTLVGLIGDYAKDSVQEKVSLEEVRDMSIGELLGDIVPTLPAHLSVDLPSEIVAIMGDD